MDVVTITTFNRQTEVKNLVESIRRLTDAKIIVFDDASDPAPDLQCEVVRYHNNHGRKKYYRLITDVFKRLKQEQFRYFFMLPDDIIPSDDIFETSVKIWEAIKDERKICLSIGHTHNRHYQPCWTYFQPIRLGDVVLTGWNDLCFMAERRFLEELNYEIEEPLPGYDWRSSGVGRFISRKLQPYYNLYHVDKTLCEFPANESRMRELFKELKK